MRPPRLLSLTRAGKFFLLMTLAVGFGAINTGNNLLFLLFGMLLSLIVASGLLSEAVIRNIRVRRRLPRQVEAKQPAPGEFRLINRGWWPALSIEPSEQNPRAVAGPLEGRRLGPRSVPWWKFWRRQTDEESRPLAAAYCLRAAPGDETTLSTHYAFTARGRYELPGLQLKTRFPFGLFEKTRRFDAPASILVYPESAPAERWLGQLRSRDGDRVQKKRGTGDEFFGLRDYRPGEDQRSIHWKSTARRGEPVVRETEARNQRALLVVLDNRAPRISDAYRRRFELGLGHLTGLLHSLSRRGYRVHLQSCHGMAAPETAGDIIPLLDHMAVVDLFDASRPGPTIDEQADDSYETRIHVGFQELLPSATDGVTPLSFEALETADETPGASPGGSS